MAHLTFGERWLGRGRTAIAAMALLLAWILVRCVKFSLWQRSLGKLARDAAPAPVSPAPHLSPDSMRAARRRARSVERAACRLPIAMKCLPRAVALQWLLRRVGIGSRLVIAVHRTDRRGEHAFHAWVERGGEFLVGDCDRAVYQPMMIFVQGGDEGASVNG